jgi:hypothetical protein
MYQHVDQNMRVYNIKVESGWFTAYVRSNRTSIYICRQSRLPPLHLEFAPVTHPFRSRSCGLDLEVLAATPGLFFSLLSIRRKMTFFRPHATNALFMSGTVLPREARSENKQKKSDIDRLCMMQRSPTARDNNVVAPNFQNTMPIMLREGAGPLWSDWLLFAGKWERFQWQTI